MKILMAAGELAPYVRSGELADAVARLSGELCRVGQDVSVVIPFYRVIREDKSFKAKKTKLGFNVQVGGDWLSCEIFEAKAANGVRVFLVARDEFFDRTGVYGANGRDYQDNAARFIFFTKCVIELARRMEAAPDVVHLHGWETALAPVFVREQRLPFRTVLSPHSLEFQGNFWSYDFALTNLPGDYFGPKGVEYFGSMNCLKAGILFADAVVLPGERMVSAAQTSDYGCGLESVLREHQQKLCGLPNAEGLENWQPGSDDSLPAVYSADKPAARSKNRLALLKVLELPVEPTRAIFVVCAQATGSLGVDLLLASLDRVLVTGVRLLLFGSVQKNCEMALGVARRKHAGSFVHIEDFDRKTARLALAGSDLFLLPGPVEPRAKWLRRALRYGAVPVAQQCGGLFQYVRDWEPGNDAGNGFIFFHSTVDGLADACRRAVTTMSDESQAAVLRDHCLRREFSPEASAQDHQALYERLTGIAPVAQSA